MPLLCLSTFGQINQFSSSLNPFSLSLSRSLPPFSHQLTVCVSLAGCKKSSPYFFDLLFFPICTSLRAFGMSFGYSGRNLRFPYRVKIGEWGDGVLAFFPPSSSSLSFFSSSVFDFSFIFPPPWLLGDDDDDANDTKERQR